MYGYNAVVRSNGASQFTIMALRNSSGWTSKTDFMGWILPAPCTKKRTCFFFSSSSFLVVVVIVVMKDMVIVAVCCLDRNHGRYTVT
mmetsp:Transcript_21537/g.36691  ORF Transcript_21537/g.36691 Transcript_21537/m.36691 type:complete len:87 (-) Transcript_21537:607-867(-)